MCFTFYPGADKPKKEKKPKRKKTKKIKKPKRQKKNVNIDFEGKLEQDTHQAEEPINPISEPAEEQPQKEKEQDIDKGTSYGDAGNFPNEDDKEEKTPLKEKIAGLKRKWQMIKPYVPLGKKSFVRLLKLIRFYDFELYLNVADEDAYEAAMKFGKMNGAVYGALGVFMTIFTVEIRHTQINCKFNSDKTDFAGRFYIKVRPSTLFRIVISTAFSALRIFLKERKKRKLESQNNDNNEMEM